VESSRCRSGAPAAAATVLSSTLGLPGASSHLKGTDRTCLPGGVAIGESSTVFVFADSARNLAAAGATRSMCGTAS
jgi:hypothetical protein